MAVCDLIESEARATTDEIGGGVPGYWAQLRWPQGHLPLPSKVGGKSGQGGGWSVGGQLVFPLLFLLLPPSLLPSLPSTPPPPPLPALLHNHCVVLTNLCDVTRLAGRLPSSAVC